MFPTKEQAEELLKEAEKRNPGPWGNHSRTAAHCAERIAFYCDDMDAAMQFLDFLCREDIAQMNFEYIYFSTPNDAVIAGLSEEDRKDTALVPSENATENCEVCIQTDAETIDLMNELWKELKAE